MITREMSMCQAVLNNLQLLSLFPRFSIKLGYGERSVEEVCELHHVNTDFFLEIANSYLYEDYVPSVELSRYPLGAVVRYITSTHEYYLETALPLVERKIYRMLEQSALSDKEIQLVTGFFNDYKKDFMTHISDEEEHVLPYILELEKQSSMDHPSPDFIEKLDKYSIRQFELEHDRLEYSLENLSRLIIKYLPPCEDFQLCHQVIKELSALVKDLVDHADMEDKVLIPRVAELEDKLRGESTA